MSAEPKDAAATAVDERHPWLGLDSFTEATRDYFYGRDEEVAELARRVQRKLLTILFGQSGLGKTSILRAGLVPRLRGHGYCPVYVRIAYSADAPEPGEQIKQAILATARQSGRWSQAGVAEAGESLWEFLHHRDDVLLDEAGNTLIPLLIFDQFEEIFTLAQTDEAGRARAARFIDDLADLVENRPPRDFEAKLEADEALAERFDFSRGDYRVLIALREDYLAPLEGLKANMPSVTQNRLRLAPMTGRQGLAAILGPGKGLVSEEVAEAIVRFVAGGSEIANAEVEPSLLSLVCRELNDARIAEGREEISQDLLAGSHDTILSNFYERALADQPAAVRRIIEDELLTESGYRENVAEETLRSRFAAAGAAPDALATLVNRRLLRIEERLDVRRVELTHDVLCGVVMASRDLRHEREAREATERMLAEQQERAAAARRALVRARQVAAACIVLALGAIAAAVFAYVSSQRAKRAEAVAQQARVQAESLLGYLTVNFARELESSGRLDVVANLAKQEIDYFHGLPDEMQGPDTQRTAAGALIQFARAKRRLGDLEPAWDAVREAEASLEALRRGGDDSEATIVALTRALDVKTSILNNREDPAALPTLLHGVEVLGALSKGPDPSVTVRETEMDLLNSLGFLYVTIGDGKAIDALKRAMELGQRLGAREIKDTYVSGLYAEAGAWLIPALLTAGRGEEAKAVGADAAAVADGVLTQRPGDRQALYAQGLIQSSLGDAATSQLRPHDSIPYHLRAVVVQQTLVDFDPGNKIAHNNLASVQWSLAEAYWSIGELDEALATYDSALKSIAVAAEGGAGLKLSQLRILSQAAEQNADAGRAGRARELADEAAQAAARLRGSVPADSRAPRNGDLMVLRTNAVLAGLASDPRRAAALAGDGARQAEASEAKDGLGEFWKYALTYSLNRTRAEAQLALRDYAAAAQSARTAKAAKERWQIDPVVDGRMQAYLSTLLALALSGEGNHAEAKAVIDPAVAYDRELAARNHGDATQTIELAAALYAQALSDPPRRAALLGESRALLGGLPGTIRSLASTRTWTNRVRDAGA